MLRIKKEFDLKELEKFGFKKEDEKFNYKRYYKKVNYINEIMIGIEKREIRFDPKVWGGTLESLEQLEEWQYEFESVIKNGRIIIEALIQAGLVEKVSEGDNE